MFANSTMGKRVVSLASILAFTMLPMVAAAQQPAPPPEPPKPETEQAPPPATEKPPAPAPVGPKPQSIPPVNVSVPKQRPTVRPQAAPRVAPRRVAVRPVRRAVAPPPVVPTVPVQGLPAPGALPKPPGQTITSISGEIVKSAPAFAVQDLLQASPGVSFKQGNGPRDIGISIRGSNARNGFGIRNIVVLEDGFPVTQPDGLSRTDLTDPHAYGGVDVYRGPSSAMFGNYATGGAVNFRLYRGGDINGVLYGIEGGSFGYLNNYALAGTRTGNFEGSLFASDVRGNGYISHSSFNTQTLNSLMTFTPTTNDRLTFKVIENALTTNLAIRLSLNQFRTNPFQQGCTVAATAAAGCASVNLFANGFSAPSVAQSADQASLGRHDHRNIVGTRWEHDFDNQTIWRTQFVFDDKNINQPTGATAAIGDSPSYNVISDFTARGGGIFGLEANHYLAVFYNRQRLTNYTWNVKPGGGLGSLASYYDGGHHINLGGRAREEIKLGPSWTAYAAFGVEFTTIEAVNTINSFPSGVTVPSRFDISRDLNSAPEGGLLYRPNEAWQFRSRVATGYGTPQISNLTVTSAGVSGNNSSLQTQRNLGVDLGVDWTPANWLKVSVTGFYEWFRDELVTQSAGAGLQNFTFNVPRSIHRGVEVAADWQPLPGWRLLAAYTWLDQYYQQYVEQLSAGTLTRRFDRAGNKIPGISPNEVFARLGYDQPVGPWKGFGGFIEYVWKDAFFMENANLLQAPGYGVVNANIHYDAQIANAHLKGAIFFFEVKNVFDQTYVASANNITNSINPVTGLQNPGSVLATAGTGSIYAGAPRAYVAGMKLAFR